MNSSTVRRILAAVAVGGAISLGAAAATAPAHADPITNQDHVFLTALAVDGITYSSAADAIGAAHNICDRLRQGQSYDHVTDLMSAANPNLSAFGVGYWVGAAEAAYCPALAAA